MCVTTINDKRHHDFERETRGGGKWKRVWREERKDDEIMMSKSKRN